MITCNLRRICVDLKTRYLSNYVYVISKAVYVYSEKVFLFLNTLESYIAKVMHIYRH